MKTWVGPFLVIVLFAVALAWQANTIAELRNDVLALRGDVLRLQQSSAEDARRAETAATAPVVSAARADTDAQELQQLRADVAVLKSRTQELAQVAQAAKAAATSGHAADAAPVHLTPASAWKNAGRDTPGAAIETALWAAVGGDLDTLANSLSLTPDAQAKADALFASMSDATRAEYGSPEKLLALMIAKDAGKLTGLQILGQRELNPDDMGVRIRVGNDEGQTKDESMLLHRVDDGWKLQLTDKAVDKFAQKIKGGK